jgi:hypothetical protein
MQATCLFGFWPKTFSIIRISCLDEVVRLRHIDYVMKLTRVRNKDNKFRRESRSVKAKNKKTDYKESGIKEYKIYCWESMKI